MSNLEQEIKELIIESLDLEDISPADIVTDEPLFEDGLGLDSIDALELGMALQAKFGVKIDAEDENTPRVFSLCSEFDALCDGKPGDLIGGTVMETRADINNLLVRLLGDMFEVAPGDIHPGAHLYDDLDIDSIDAVDLVVELRAITGKQIDPDEFKAVRTVDDVINAVASIVGVE